MSNTPTTINWKTFFAGALCGLLVGASGFFFLNPSPAVQPAPFPGKFVAARGNALATANSEVHEDLGSPETADPVRVQLRPASFPSDRATMELALELKRAGWTYIMPQPKSMQARWGNVDGQTIWWVGYWTNERDDTSSSIQPQKGARGHFIGDGKGSRHWRRGGSPPTPSQIEWLCSESGGTPPG
jgi:hypothetical protein